MSYEYVSCKSALTRSDLVEIELTIVDVCRAGERVVVAPVGAGLRLLVEQRARGTEEPEVANAAAGHAHAHVERLAPRLGVSVVRAEDAALAVKTLSSPWKTHKSSSASSWNL